MKLTFYDLCGHIPKNSWLNSNIAYIPCKRSSRKVRNACDPQIRRDTTCKIWHTSLANLDREFVEPIESHTYNEININRFT